MKRRDHLLRYIAIGFIYVAIALVFVARLITVQIAGQDYYSETVTDKTYTRTVTIQSQRGLIYDRNGKALVSNKYTYDIYLDGGSLSSKNETRNETILRLIETAKEMDEYSEGFEMPSVPFVYENGKWKLDSAFMTTVYGRRLSKLMLELGFKQDNEETGGWENTDIEAVRNKFRFRYGLVDSDGNMLYTEEEEVLLLPVRMDMELRYFSSVEPYTIIKDVDVAFISAIMEGSHRGYEVRVNAERVYEYPGYLSHILGRVGKIHAEDAEYYTSLGYSLNAIVGTSGVEKSFEEYLHGTDGVLAIVEDEYGNVVDTYVKKEPVAGNDVYLTIDIDMQILAEKALAANIQTIVDQAVENGGTNVGEDADAGAMTAVNVKTGEVLALANYPTYNLATFNEDYHLLREDEAAPLFNRALEGIYEPGSTFKIGVAIAALQEGIITPYTEIQDEGRYKYYEDIGFTPACWIYSERYGYGRHGWINVSKAIEVSCNCFFYDVGRQLTITNMNKYCRAYGLGEATGIELSENKGVLAGPAEREAKGEIWYDGDTIQAAIGQSDNLFSPLQISNYISTVLKQGNRTNVHILYQVKDYNGNIVKEAETSVVDSIEISSGYLSTVKNAMSAVINEGSAARIFKNYPMKIGGKTGTAQVSSNSSDNAIFTAFAPFNDPEIVATCIIEHGASGTDAAYSVRDFFTKYFDIEYAMNVPGYEETDDTDDSADTGDTNG